jgi:hypothetical protein
MMPAGQARVLSATDTLWTAAAKLSVRYGIVWLRGTRDRTRSVVR